MYYFTTENQTKGHLSIFSMAKTIKAAAAYLSRQQKAWPDKYHDGMNVIVCKKSKAGEMIHYGNYRFDDGELKRNKGFWA